MKNKPHKPAQAPEFNRKIIITRSRFVGVLLMFLLPVFALTGFFDLKTNSAKTEDTGLVLKAEYPTQLRYQQPALLKIAVQNSREQEIPVLHVNISREYLHHFSNVSVQPGIKIISDKDYIAELGLEAGETKFITIEVEPESMGHITGSVSIRDSVTAKEGAEIKIPLKTYVLP